MTTLERTEHWNRIIQDWRDSGYNQKEFCQRNEISYSNFLYWRRKENGLQETRNDTPHAVEVSSTLRGTDVALLMEFESHGIVVAVSGSEATVTVNGRINLEQFERIIAACGPSCKGI